MNVPLVSAPAAMAAPMQPNRAYTVKPAGQEDIEPKEITTEQIQALLDENSNLIVELITLNNEIKQAKGTGQQSEFTDKLDKKRKKLNKNLMMLAKWADEASDQPPRPQPNPYVPPQAQYAARGMVMNPVGMNPQMAMGHPQMQMPRFNPQAQAQMQAMAQAQYQARMSSMGAHAQYGGMQTAPQRYHDPSMGYGGMGQPMARPMNMNMTQQGYVSGPPMGYAMAPPHGYNMMGAPQQPMQRMPAPSDAGASATPDVGRSSN